MHQNPPVFLAPFPTLFGALFLQNLSQRLCLYCLGFLGVVPVVYFLGILVENPDDLLLVSVAGGRFFYIDFETRLNPWLPCSGDFAIFFLVGHK